MLKCWADYCFSYCLLAMQYVIHSLKYGARLKKDLFAIININVNNKLIAGVNRNKNLDGVIHFVYFSFLYSSFFAENTTQSNTFLSYFQDNP